MRTIQQPDTTLPNSVKLIFEVNTFSKVKIDEIVIDGNEEFSDTKLKKKLKKTNEHPRIAIVRDVINRIADKNAMNVKTYLDSRYPVTDDDVKEYVNKNFKLNFLNGSKFIAKEYEEDKKSMISFYNSKGFRDAEILSDTIYKVGKSEIGINIKLEEGRKYYYRDITWSGNYVYTSEQLSRMLGIQKGDLYNREELDKRLNASPREDDLSSLYMNDGYLYFQNEPVEVRVEGDSIDMEIRIQEGPQFTINRIILKGNERTSDHVVLRELKILPGQKFDRSLLIRTIRELSALGYFDPEQIEPRPIPKNDGTVDIEFNLVERPSDSIELSGGWGGFFGFVGTVGLVFNNFSIKNIKDFSKWKPLPVGDGQKLSLRVQANGRRFQNYSISFQEPWLGGTKPISFSVAFNHSVQRGIDFLANQEFGYFKITGGEIGLGKRLKWPDDFFMIRSSIGFNNYDFENYGTSLGLGYPTGNSKAFTLNTTLSRISISDQMYPRYGSQITLSATATPPFNQWRNVDLERDTDQEIFKWLEYHKWMFDASFFLPLDNKGKLVMNTRAHMGFLGSYGGADIIPLERFVLGGDGLTMNNFVLGQEIIGLRGYENQSITPQTANRRGGVVYNKYVMEMRYLVSPNPSATIYVHTFLEAGNNFGSYREFNPFNLKRSAGIGARIFMPAFGLLGVDWGYGFDTAPGTNQRSGAQFHFTIGQQLR